MKILILSHEFPPLTGGGALFAKNPAEHFAKWGHSVTVITSRAKNSPKHEVINGLEIHRVFTPFRSDKSQTPLVSMFFYLLSAFLKTIQLRKLKKFDIINTHFAFPSGPLGIMAKRIFKTKNALFIIGRDIFDPTRKFFSHDNFLYKIIIKLVINDADLLIAESKDIAVKAKRLYSHRKKTHIIPVGFRPPDKKLTKLKLVKKKNKKIKLIAIGRLVERKGFDYLIKGVINIKNVLLYIIGDGPEKEKLQEIIKNNRLQNKVFLSGAVSEKDKWRQLLSSDIYILSSFHEGFGIVLQEAMYAGLPIISTDRGGQMDLITEKNAVLIRPKSSKEIEKAVKFLIANPEIRSKIAFNNKEKIKNFHISKITKRYLNLFQKIIS